jgi:hypothetical protein
MITDEEVMAAIEAVTPQAKAEKKINQYHGILGLVREKKVNEAVIREWNGAQAGMDSPDGRKWTVECVTHRCKSFYATFRLAGKASAHPEEWCNGCKGQPNG